MLSLKLVRLSTDQKLKINVSHHSSHKLWLLLFRGNYKSSIWPFRHHSKFNGFTLNISFLTFIVNWFYLQLVVFTVKDKKWNRFAAEVKTGCYDLQHVPLFLGMNTGIGLADNYSSDRNSIDHSTYGQLKIIVYIRKHRLKLINLKWKNSKILEINNFKGTFQEQLTWCIRLHVFVETKTYSSNTRELWII